MFLLIITQLSKIVNTFYAVFTKITKQMMPFYEIFRPICQFLSTVIFFSYILSIFWKL
ncbi:hypothetical protein BRYFOR_05276 [Marvinbryantia formatexigens DSM 14469]|uniref:Uncharacterized protein n=1 Tax=Marvinbryantia formatexigens DSM 14469 TaxID=478749 RepID=C6L9I5_9FIRM|nr:hypothetical protein BRYFOR_05276 [Marvinbryantia formatexigens DSM 14469]